MNDGTLPYRCPFTVLFDRREKLPFRFEGLRTDARQGRRPLVVPVEVTHLETGDYTLWSCTTEIAIERKSLADLYGTIGQGRRLFRLELERLSSFVVAAIIVEADWSTILNNPPSFSRLPPKNVYRTILAWQQDFPTVAWWMCPDRRFAEITTFRILERYWKRKTSREVVSREVT